MKAVRRLLYVANDTSFFLNQFLPIARGAKMELYEVHVALPSLDDTSAILREGLILHLIPLKRGEVLLGHELKTFYALYKLYRTIQPDLVHHVTFKPILFGGIAARMAGIPAMVNIITGFGYAFISNGIKARLIRYALMKGLKMAFRHARQRVIFQNPDDMAFLVNEGIAKREDSRVIRAVGVDMDVFKPTPGTNGIPIVMLASRMLWDKGVKEFVEAAANLKEAGLEASFVLVGDTDPKNPSAIPTSQLKAWHDSGVVEWWGYREDMPEILQKAHIVCLPSYREGLPKVLVEAAACARAIVTTDAPGCREIVKDHENGLLVEARDSKGLAKAIRLLIEDPKLRMMMGLKGREIAMSEFSEEKTVKETLMIYKELLDLQ